MAGWGHLLVQMYKPHPVFIDIFESKIFLGSMNQRRIWIKVWKVINNVANYDTLYLKKVF